MEYTYISSRQNSLVQTVTKLSTKKGRSEAGLYIVEGKKLCLEALGRAVVKYAVISEKCKDKGDFCTLCQKCGGEVIVLSDSAFEKISQDSSPDGIAFVCEGDLGRADVTEEDKVFILECVRDPGNVGTIIRSAAAFGYTALVLIDCADVLSPKVLRASMGAAFKIKLLEARDAKVPLETLRKQNRRIFAATLGHDSLVCGKDKLEFSDCLIVGNEGHGVSEKTVAMCDGTMIIPMTDKTESLNAASAATVLMWQYGAINN